MKSIISKHNKKILNSTPPSPIKRTCNCRDRDNCPLNNQCLSSAIVYNANLTAGVESKDYIGATETAFKSRLGNHRQSFNNQERCHETCLSKYIWDMKNTNANANYDIKWSILHQTFPYQCGTRKCDLCLTEKLLILYSDPACTLNKRSEIMNKCRHNLKYKLKNVK